MKHKEGEWEKAVRQEPFAASPFTEEHKQNVLHKVAWIKYGPGQKSDAYNSGISKQHVHLNERKRGPRSRGAIILGTTAVAAAAVIILWHGQLVEPVIERVYPAAALQVSNDASLDLLTSQMKKTVAVAMRDYLGKQLLVTKVQNLPISGRIYVEAGNGSEEEYANIWLDATTGNLREVEMRREMQANELEHRFLRQVPALLAGIGSDSTLRPVSARRYVKMKQGELGPASYTTLTLENEAGYGEIIWLQDEAVSVSGDLEPDQVSQTVLANAEDSVEALSGKPAPDLTSIYRIKDDEHGEDRLGFSFGQRYNVTNISRTSGVEYSVMDLKTERIEYGSWEEVEAYHKKLLEIKESALREKAEPIVRQIFQIDLQAYKLHRNPETPGIVTFELESTRDVIQIRYGEDATITMITRSDL